MTKANNQVAKHLSPEEHILTRPNMYLGSTSKEEFSQYVFNEYKTIQYVPGLLKCVNEIIDNAIDVAIKTNFKFANKIDVEMTSGYVKVSDNGTGMPVVKVDDKDGNKVWNPVLAWTYSNAGTNFGDDSSDRMTIGMHGIGATAASIFSKYFKGVTSDGKKKLTVVTRDNNKLESAVSGRSKKQFTSVYFEPDFSRFDSSKGFDETHVTVIEDRIHKLAALYPDIKFTFNGEEIRYKHIKEYVETFNKEFVYVNTDDVFIAFLEKDTDDNGDFKFISVVNGLNTPNGGSHINHIISKISEHVRPVIKKKHKIDVTAAQMKNHLFPVIFFKNFKNFKSESQTKESVKNTKQEIENYLKNFDFEKLAKKIVNKDSIIEPVIHYQLLKQQQKENRQLKQEQKKALKKNVAKHIAPNSKDVSKNILYIVEGDSAKSPFMATRNKKHHGIYPLKGKMMNVRRKSAMEVVANNECKDIMSILGLTIGEEVPKKLPYSKIYITADADIDGYCITSQVINFLMFWPELFDRGIVYILYTPIIEIMKGNKKVNAFYRLEDYQNYTVKSGEKVKYIKGLGSMENHEYKHYLIDSPKVEKVVRDKETDLMLDIAFSDDPKKRREWLG